MAKQISKPAAGSQVGTGMMKTPPAPTKPARIRASDLDGIFQGGGMHDGQVGQNRYAGASSYPMDKVPTSPMGQDLETSAAQGADAGNVMAAIRQAGTAAFGTKPETGDAVLAVDSMAGQQLRKLAGRAQPTTFSMHDPNANNPKVPSPPNTIGGNNSAFAAELSARQHGRK